VEARRDGADRPDIGREAQRDRSREPGSSLATGSAVLTSFRRSLRQPNPVKVFARAGLLFLGVALTWMSAAAGLYLLTDPHGGAPSKRARAIWQVREIRNAVTTFQIERGRCPATRDDLIAAGYVAAKRFTDPWDTSVVYRCSDEDVRVRSAGPDRVFGNADDVADEP
jgi:hypothetical protein